MKQIRIWEGCAVGCTVPYRYVLMECVLCLWDPWSRVDVNCCVYVQIKVVNVSNTLPLASWFVYNHSFSPQGPDDASAMGPSELILTRGTLNEEEEERESDTDDIDHEGKGMRPETAHAVRKCPLHFITWVACKESLESKHTSSHLNTCQNP